jgi:hypothetical protein
VRLFRKPEVDTHTHETVIAVGRQGSEDERPEMTKDDVLHWSIKMSEKIDQTITAISQQYAAQPEQILALFANIGMYCMAIAKSINEQILTNPSEPEPLTPAPPTVHWDPNRGYL